jgi:hypothetical protein
MSEKIHYSDFSRKHDEAFRTLLSHQSYSADTGSQLQNRFRNRVIDALRVKLGACKNENQVRAMLRAQAALYADNQSIIAILESVGSIFK